MRRSIKHPVADTSTYYRNIMGIIRWTGLILPLGMIIFGLLVRGDILDSSHYLGDSWYIGLSVAFTILAVVQYFITKYRPEPENYLGIFTAYHVLGSAFIITISGFDSPIPVGWIALTVASDTYFGTLAFVLSAICLSFSCAASLILAQTTTIDGTIETILYCAILIGMGLMLSRIRNVVDKERYALAKSREDQTLQRERLLALVNSMGDAVIATDDEGVIKIFNAAALNLLDTNIDLTNKKIDRILKLCDEKAKRTNALELAKAHKTTFSRTDLLHQFADGEKINLYINFSPIQLSYHSRNDKGYIFILRDITKEKTLEDERDEFISVVSHELRTPVAIVEGNISNVRVLQKRGANPTVLEHALDDAHDQVMYLAKMINDLGTLSRAERGLDSAIEAIDPNELLNELFKNFTNSAHKKGLRLDLDVSPQLPRIRTSCLYIKEILQNLIGNAIKYTDKGSVTLTAHKAPGDGVYFAVQDTGIGVSKSDQHHIFEKFYRSEDYRTRETSGTGLGLYISQKLAAKIGTVIEFESRLNHGSTFRFVIKSPRAAHSEPIATAKQKHPK
jgi:two-component system, OmpR family, phosphate regulon sensor histidine kinase PhoR